MRLAGAIFLALLTACEREGGRTAPSDAGTPSPTVAPSLPSASAAPTSRANVEPVGGCGLVLSDPSRSGLAWNACSEGPPTCRELASTLPGGPFGSRLRAEGAATRSGTMVLVQMTGISDGRERFVLGPPDGPARMILDATCKFDRATRTGPFAVSPDGALLSFASPGERTFFAGPFAEDPAWGAPAARLTEAALGEVIFNELAVSQRSIRAVDARQRVLRSSPETGEFSARAAGPLFRGSFGRVVAHDAVTVFRVETIPEAFAIQYGDTSPAFWLKVPSGLGLSAPAFDGNDLYWLQGSGRDRNNRFSSVDVYSAPFPTSNSPPVPRRIAPAATARLSDPEAGAGHVAYAVYGRDGRRAVNVLDVATLRTSRFEAPASKVVSRILYVDEKELGVEVSDDYTMTSPTHTWRVELASLPSLP